jgi:NADH dehydrogenase
MYTALRLQAKLRRDEASVTVVDPQSYLTYQPFLPEAAAGNLEPRHVVVPLRRVLPKVRLLNGRITRIDHARRIARFAPLAGAESDLSYDVLVLAPGSVSRTLPIPGLAERGIGFKTVAEAIYLRNHILEKLDIAGSTDDLELRRRVLTFLFIGGGYAGVEALAELEDMARDATEYYPTVRPQDMRWVLVEAAGRRWERTSAPTPSTSCVNAGSRCCSARGSRRWRAGTWCSTTVTSSTRKRSCGRPGSSRARWWPTATCRWTRRAG